MTLFLDLDGVLADFDGQLKKYGVHRNDTSYIHTSKHGWTDEQIALDKEVRRCMGEPGFWEDMPLMRDAYELWDFCQLYRPVILTAVPSVPEWRCRVEYEKGNWINKYLGFKTSVVYCYRSEKQEYASPLSILVDDMIQNIQDWTQAGGKGVLHTDTDNTIKKLNFLYKEVL